MRKSLTQTLVVTGGAMVGITASVTSGAAAAWGPQQDAGLDQASAISTTTPQTSTKTSTDTATPAASSTPSATATTAAKKSTSTSKTTTTKKKTTKKTTTKTTTTPSTAPSTNASTDGTFVGSSVRAGFYGSVQVQITVAGGNITSVDVLQAPSGRNSRYTNYAVPILTQETLSQQSANIATAGGASYTSRAFISSLQSALTKAGL